MIQHNYEIFKWLLDDRVRSYLIHSGLHKVSHLGSVRIDHAFVNYIGREVATGDLHLPPYSQ